MLLWQLSAQIWISCHVHLDLDILDIDTWNQPKHLQTHRPLTVHRWAQHEDQTQNHRGCFSDASPGLCTSKHLWTTWLPLGSLGKWPLDQLSLHVSANSFLMTAKKTMKSPKGGCTISGIPRYPISHAPHLPILNLSLVKGTTAWSKAAWRE